LQDATKLDIETVCGQRGRADRDVGFSSGGDGHDLGLRIPVVTYVICHHSRRSATLGRRGTAIAVASIVVIVVVIAAAVCRRPETATVATFRVSGLCGSGGGGVRGGATRRRQRQVADAAPATADAAVLALLLHLLLRRADATAADATAVTRLGRRRSVQRLEFGGHSVVYDVEAHGRERHAGQYIHGTEPNGGRTGERHVH